MILSILAIIYVSLICYFTGAALVKWPGSSIESAIFNCFAGLAAHGILFTFISIFFPIGGIIMQLVLPTISIVLYLVRKPAIIIPRLQWHPGIKLLLFLSLALVLVMNNWYVNHPDTLNYHAQNIRWVQNYRSVPGLVNLQYHYGLQSSLFVLDALFSFRFAGSADLGFVNITVICWLLVFILSRIDLILKDEKLRSYKHAVPWVLLLGFLFWSFNQVRLSASSASVDFIAAICCWLCFYLFIHKDRYQSFNYPGAILLLVCFTISIKYSTLPLLLIPAYLLYKMPDRRMSSLIRFSGLCLVFLLPILARNTIASGYPLFPSGVAGMGFDWQAPQNLLLLYGDYIKAYARLGVGFDETAIREAADMNFISWVPAWFARLAAADKFLLISILVMAVAGLVRYRQSTRRTLKKTAPQKPIQMPSNYFPALIIAAAGTVGWFVFAPDPRFGYGFLIPLAGLLMWQLSEWSGFVVHRKQLTLAAGLLAAAMGAYTAYRLVYYFEVRQLITPAGIKKSHGVYVRCMDMEVIQPPVGEDCGDLDTPCIKNCEGFLPRGTTVPEGFRPEHP